MNLAAAVLLAVVGVLTVVLSQSAGYAVPIWPAAGLTVALLLGWSWRCLPGLWFGSWAIDIWIDPSLAGAGLAALTASAASIQALLAAWLARRYFEGARAFSGDYGLATFLICVGPLTCLLAASFGMLALLGSGKLAPTALFDEWLLWWVGDTLGVWLFAPLVHLLWPGKHPYQFQDRGNYRFAVPLVVTFTLLTAGYVGLTQLENLRAQNEAQQMLERVSDEAAQHINKTLVPLEGFAHFMAASKRVSRKEFHEYSRSFVNHPALISIDWAPRVSHAERSDFESALGKEGFTGFPITEVSDGDRLRPARERDEYYPILYTEPWAAGSKVLGLDHGFESPRRDAMTIARGSGKAITSQHIHLVRNERRATLVYVPVWRLKDGEFDPVLSGFVVGVVDIDALFAPLLAKAQTEHFTVRITDVTAGAPAQAILANAPLAGPFDWQHDLHVGGRAWRLELKSLGSLPRGEASQEKRLFLGFALANAFLAVFATLGSASRQLIVSRKVTERTAQLHSSEERYRRLIELSPFGILVQCDGRCVFVNASALSIYGASGCSQMIGRPLLEFVHPDSQQIMRERLSRRATGEPVGNAAILRYLRLDGSYSWGEITSAACEYEGRPGSLILIQDISARVHAEEQLAELNAELQQRVEERSLALAELHAKQQEIRAVLDHLLDCVITIDSSGRMQNLNPAVEALLGYQVAELIGEPFAKLLSTQPPSTADCWWEQAPVPATEPCSLTIANREVVAVHKNGTTLALEVSVSSYSVNNEHYRVATLRDIREYRALIAKLTLAREDAEQANRAKSAFLATMSHEIRTPMNGVIGLTDVLSRDALLPHQTELVTTIRESAHGLLKVIDDILDFSKVEAGKLELESAPLALPELIDTLCRSLIPLARSHGVELEQRIAADVPRWVCSDATRLRQILYNLIGNAIKFSGGRSSCPGRVSVHATLACIEPLRISISVQDNGIGIAGTHLATLFAPFTQAESSTTRRFGGSGLGLAICKRLVALFEGVIEVSSRPGEGSTFTVNLPLAPLDMPAQDEPRDVYANFPSTVCLSADRRILVVEDDVVNRKVIRQQLTLLGYRFDIAEHGAQGLAMWRAGQYDLLLSDLHMPHMDGYELARRIRNEESAQQRRPILALTANVLQDERESGQTTIDQHLTKPILLADLQKALARWLLPDAPELSNGRHVLVETDALAALVGDNSEMIREILGDYLQTLLELAPKFEDALREDDIDTIYTLSHRLKSSSRAVGAIPLSQVCASIEQAICDSDTRLLTQQMAAFAQLQLATRKWLEQFLEAEVSAL